MTTQFHRQQPEEWREIPGYEGFYEASNRGNIRSLPRELTAPRGGTYIRAGKVLKPWTLANGYLQVGLYREGKHKARTVHSLVLEAFAGPRPSGAEVCHNDGNKVNNNVDNLRWGSKSENAIDRTLHGTNVDANKTHCPRGHELVVPNIVPRAIRQGKRDCLACSRATNNVRYDPSRKPRFSRIADDHYLKIMNSKESTHA